MRTSLLRKAATPSDAFRNPVLDSISVAAFQDPSEFVARAAFPTIGGPTAGQYYEINTDTIAMNKAAKRGPGTQAAEGTWDLSKKAYTCEQLGYREKVTEEMLAATGSAAQADKVATMSVAEVMLIASEIDWANRFFKTGVWSRDMVGAAGTVADTSYKYWSTAGSTPISDVLSERKRMRRIGKRFPNTLILGANVEDTLLTHADIISRVNAGQTPGAGADPTLNDLAKFFKVQRVLVATASYNSAAEGQAASNGFILNPDSAWLGFVNPTPSIMTPSAGYRFADQEVSGNSYGVRNWRFWEQAIRSWIVEGAVDDTYKAVSTNLGTFFSLIKQ